MHKFVGLININVCYFHIKVMKKNNIDLFKT